MTDYTIKAKEKLEKLKTIDKELRELKNKSFSDEENALFQNFSNSIRNCYALIKKTLEDDVVDPGEMEHIQIIEKKILQDARATILEDGKVSDDENALLKKLIAIFEPLTS